MGDGSGWLHRCRHRGAQRAGVGDDLVAAQRDRAAERGHRPAPAAGRRTGEAQSPDQADGVRRAVVRVCRERPGRKLQKRLAGTMVRERRRFAAGDSQGVLR